MSTFFSSKIDKILAAKYGIDLLVGRDTLPSSPNDPRDALLSHLQSGTLGNTGRQVVLALIGKHPCVKDVKTISSEYKKLTPSKP